jgi:hypothetical protein
MNHSPTDSTYLIFKMHSFIDGYYKNLPIKPGVDIYRAIVESKLPFSRLNIKITETLLTFDDTYWIGYSYEHGCSFIHPLEHWNAAPRLNDRTEIIQDTKYRGFVDTIEYIDTYYYKHYDVDRNLDPAVLSRCSISFPASENIEVITWDKLRQVYSYGAPAPGIMQRFVYSPTNKATLYRIVFFNPNNCNHEKANYGYLLTNKKDYFATKAQIEDR